MNKNDKKFIDYTQEKYVALFPTLGLSLERGSHSNEILKKIEEEYGKDILEGIYNLTSQNGNTAFHEFIANDRTDYALRLLKLIDEIATKNGKSKELQNIIPFTKYDDCKKMGGEEIPSKNFLMFAIAKKYDNSKEEELIQTDKQREKIIEQLTQYKNNQAILKDVGGGFGYFYLLQMKDSDDQIDELSKRKGDIKILNHKNQFQKNDAELIHWLIDKAPMECLQQKDSEGYNLADYALMKMDYEILQHLLEREPKLLESSKLYNDVLSGKFSYKEAAKKVDERYSATIAIADENEWNSKKEEIRKFLQERNNMKPVNNQKIEEKEKSNGIG